MPSRLRLSCGLLLAASVGLAAESPAPPQQHFDVQEYRVLGNTVLPSLDIERLLYPLLGANKTLTDVQGAKAALEKLYHDRGFGTVFVDIPVQDVTEGVVRLRAVEGRVERSEISGARYFSERDVIERLPAAKVGTVLNLTDLQKQLAPIGTETADRTVVPVLKAGSVPGAVDVAFRVNDQLPLHGSVELNNQQTVDTRPLRAVLAVEYDNLFGTLDRISFQYQGTPQQVDQVKVFAANYAFHPWSSGLQASLLYINSDSNVATVGTLGVLGAYAKGAPIRIIGSESVGEDAYWYVRPDSPVKSMTDMAGRTIAYSTTGSSTHANVLSLIDLYKVDAKPVATGGFPGTWTQVMSGQIDAGWSAPPYAMEALRKGEIRVIVRSNELPLIKGQMFGVPNQVLFGGYNPTRMLIVLCIVGGFGLGLGIIYGLIGPRDRTA